MSLVVWLPLNGKLDNYGVSGAKFTTSTATVGNNGKIGRCYNFAQNSGSGIYLTTSCEEFMNSYINEHSWTLCAWVRTSSSSGTPLISLTYGLRFFVGGSTSISLYNSSRTVGCNANTATNGGVWHHVAASYNVSNNLISIYVDGVLKNTASYTSGYSYASSWTNGIFIGRDPNNNTQNDGYFYKGDVNDLRIYDHCLSIKEIQEVYSTLLIHYELDDEYVENTTNLAAHSKTSHNGFGIIDGNNLLSLGDASSYQTGESYVARIAKASGTPSSYCSYRKLIATTNGSSYTFSFKYKMISGSESQICGHWAGGTGHSISVSDAGDGWKYAYFTDTASSTSMNVGVGFTGSGALNVLITEIQFENTNHPTPFALTTRTSSIVYDNSGYQYDAVGNALTISTDTPRYTHCYQFNGTSSYIEIPAAIGPVFDSDYSMCFWIKGSSDNGTRSAYFGSGTSAYTLNIERTSSNTLRFYNANNPDYTISGFSVSDNEWIHIAIVKSGTTVNFYRNGTLIGTKTGVGTHSSYDIKYYLGRDYRAQSSGLFFSGKMSDFRLYATALNAVGVYDLSRTAASIDKNGRLHAYEFVEDGTKIKVGKTGVVTEGSFIEDDTGKTRFGKDSSIYSTEFIEW